jgi:hypothetical protein
MISSSPNPDIGDCHCERSEAISARCDGIATHLSGARNDSSEKRFCFLNRDLGYQPVEGRKFLEKKRGGSGFTAFPDHG